MNKEDAKWLLENLRKVQFFSKFSLENIDNIIQHFKKYTFNKGKTIIKEGEPGSAFYVIESGSVKVVKSKLIVFGKKITELGPGKFFGEMSLIIEDKTSASVIAIENTQVFSLLKTDFDEVIRGNPDVAGAMRYVAERRRFETETL